MNQERYDEILTKCIALVKATDVYKEYKDCLDELKKDPELKRRVDDFRLRNYNFQQSGEISLNEYEKMRVEMVDFRASDQRVDNFLDAELALCRMLQDVSFRVVEALEFE